MEIDEIASGEYAERCNRLYGMFRVMMTMEEQHVIWVHVMIRTMMEMCTREDHPREAFAGTIMVMCETFDKMMENKD